MALVRVIAAGLDEGQVVLRVRASLRDEDVTSVVVHKAGSQIHHDGREFVVGNDGQLRPLAEAVATC